MSKSENQKQKLLYIEQYLRENTDEHHIASTAQLIAYLEEQGITAERKSIYSDIDTLIDFGFDIIKLSGRNGGCYMASREFEVAEVKLLVDLVQSSKFITEKKSRELIKKLETLVPHRDALTLQRQVVVSDRNKAINESIYYSVDVIYDAMAHNEKVSFQYFEWDENKKPVPRKGGAIYEVSPYLLTWDDEKYYLIGFDSVAGILKHYRVDKMMHPERTGKKREGEAEFARIDVASYAKKTFGMFSGESRTVRLVAPRSMTGVMVDRFGTDLAMRLVDEEHIQIRADVSVSPQFYGWLAGLGSRVRVVAPEDVAEDYKKYLKQIIKEMD